MIRRRHTLKISFCKINARYQFDQQWSSYFKGYLYYCNMNRTILTLFLLLIGLNACKKDETSDAPLGMESIVGKWNASEIREREYENNILQSDERMSYIEYVENESWVIDLKEDNSFILTIDDLLSSQSEDYRDTGIYIFNRQDSLLVLRFNQDMETDTFWHASFDNAVLKFTVYEDFSWEADRTRIDYKLVR